MATWQDLVTTAVDTDCPLMKVRIYGMADAAALTAINNTTITGWSADGYKAMWQATMDATYIAGFASTASTLTLAMGVGISAAAVAPAGAYIWQTQQDGATNLNTANTMNFFFGTAAEIVTAAALSPTATAGVLTDATAAAKYGAAFVPTSTVASSVWTGGAAALADAAVLSYDWYLPTAATTPSNATATSATGDRWAQGATLNFWGGNQAGNTAGDAADVDCKTGGLVLTLGAATLSAAAGAAALAAALAY